MIICLCSSPPCQLPVVVLVDVSDKWTRNQLSPQVLQCLAQFSQVPSILVMNKVSITYLRKGSTFLQGPHFAAHTPSACPLYLPVQVDCLKQKSLLLELTAALTDGVVNGKKLKIRQAFCSQQGTHCSSPATKDPNTQSVGSPQRIGWPHFQEIFMLSALSQEDVKTLKVSQPWP